MKKSGLLLCCYLIAISVYGQPVPGSLNEAEIRLQSLFATLPAKDQDDLKLKINDSIVAILEKTLTIKGSFEYSFDSLKFVGKVTSTDQKLRILTWNIPFADATNQYFGFIMRRNGNQTDIIRLSDSSATTKEPAWVTLDADHWYGCLIYDMIEKKIDGESTYTLLGYDPDNLFLSRKIVDVLWFRDNVPVFGKPVFQYKKTLQSRLIFEYSAKVQMMLTWDKELNVIVFDHLVPFNNAHAGDARYYGPDMSYDGLRFEKGTWIFTENLDPRNSNPQ